MCWSATVAEPWVISFGDQAQWLKPPQGEAERVRKNRDKNYWPILLAPRPFVDLGPEPCRRIGQ